MPRTALFPGSFDPVTNGHLDVVRQAARLCDRLILAIGTHPGKTPLFSVEERLDMLAEACKPIARETLTREVVPAVAGRTTDVVRRRTTESRSGGVECGRSIRSGDDFRDDRSTVWPRAQRRVTE